VVLYMTMAGVDASVICADHLMLRDCRWCHREFRRVLDWFD
jgi:hypothetical protein